MKKLVVILIMALMLNGTAYAVSSVKDCTVSVNVVGDFYLDLGAAWIDLGNVQAGQTSTTKNLSINTISSTGNSWSIMFKNTNLVKETDATKVIPNDNTYIKFTKAGTATGTSPYASGGTFPGTTDTLLYDSGTGETGNKTHTADLRVTVPAGQASGFYKTIITFTMIED